ncbi:hypothetical protein [Yoonia vestfoldensis]|uniref:hypothetical protein n=1 Tax=Yoonia vestfoldensis TaxID=245188 RepID=UPI00036BE7BE|nr:hypothetical protein [Yoonia vestfoldensis]
MTYGARLGIVQDGDVRRTHLLVELPAAAADLGVLMIPAISGALKDIGKNAVRLTQLAFDGGSGALTLYGVIKGANRGHLPLLADIAQVCPDRLAMAIDGLADASPCGSLPIRDLRFGLAARTNGKPPALTLYLSTPEMFGCDATITHRIMACGGSRLKGYDALLDHLPPLHAPGITHHGYVGLAAQLDAMPTLSVSVAAPWTCPAE